MNVVPHNKHMVAVGHRLTMRPALRHLLLAAFYAAILTLWASLVFSLQLDYGVAMLAGVLALVAAPLLGLCLLIHAFIPPTRAKVGAVALDLTLAAALYLSAPSCEEVANRLFVRQHRVELEALASELLAHPLAAVDSVPEAPYRARISALGFAGYGTGATYVAFVKGGIIDGRFGLLYVTPGADPPETLLRYPHLGLERLSAGWYSFGAGS
jgi:hypothetical protein